MSKRISKEPLLYLKWYLIDKPQLLLGWNITMGQGDIYVYPVKHSLYHHSKIAIATYSIMKQLHIFLIIFAFLAIFYAIKNKDLTTFLPYILLIYVCMVYIATQSEARYSIPIRPVIYLCASFFLSNLLTTLKKYK